LLKHQFSCKWEYSNTFFRFEEKKNIMFLFAS